MLNYSTSIFLTGFFSNQERFISPEVFSDYFIFSNPVVVPTTTLSNGLIINTKVTIKPKLNDTQSEQSTALTNLYGGIVLEYQRIDLKILEDVEILYEGEKNVRDILFKINNFLDGAITYITKDGLEKPILLTSDDIVNSDLNETMEDFELKCFTNSYLFVGSTRIKLLKL